MTTRRSATRLLIVLSLFVLLLGARRWARRNEAAAPETPAAPSLVAGVQTLQDGGARSDWLRTGDRIAFDKIGKNGLYDIYTMKPDGSDVKCLTCDRTGLGLPTGNIGQPTWDPSGRYLAFEAEKSSHRKVRMKRVVTPGVGVLNDLWVLDLKAGKATKLVNVPDEPDAGILHPRFSEDGTRLSWSEMKGKAALRKGGVLGYWALKVADFRTDGERPRLENTRSYEPCGESFNENQGFSPDGKQLIFSSNCETEKLLGDDIFVLDLATGKARRLTTEGYNEHGTFSPDGRYVVYMSNVGNKNKGTDYWIMKPDGSEKRRLTFFNDPASPEYAGTKVVVSRLSWKPDGTAFVGYYRSGGGLETAESPKKIILVKLRPDYRSLVP